MLPVAQTTVNSICDGGRRASAVLWAAKKQAATYMMNSDPHRSTILPASGTKINETTLLITAHSLYADCTCISMEPRASIGVTVAKRAWLVRRQADAAHLRATPRLVVAAAPVLRKVELDGLAVGELHCRERIAKQGAHEQPSIFPPAEVAEASEALACRAAEAAD